MRSWILATLVLALVSLDKSVAVPIAAAPPHNIARRDIDPEASALAANGNLPNGTVTKDGYAMHIETYPSSVATTLRAAAESVASAAQVSTLTYYMTLAANTYCDSVLRDHTWSCPQCGATSDLKFVKTFDSPKTDTNTIVVRGDARKTIFISFRGTSSLENKIADIVFVPVSYPPVSNAKVHKGFLDSYDDVKADLYATVKAQMTAYPGYTLAVTGHSLGGAMAVLCALDMYQKGYKPVLYTFGQPRVGNPTFADYVVSTGISYSRAVNKRDIVPHLPPAAFGFRHAGLEFWIKSDETVAICGNGIELSTCSNSVVPFTSVDDHGSYFGISVGGCS